MKEEYFRMFEINNLSKKFHKRKVLNSVNLKLEESGIYGLLGENGTGKTTLMRCILGLYPINGGKICWNGESVFENKEFYKKVGYLPQEFSGLKMLKVKEFLDYFADYKGLPKSEKSAEIDKVLKMVNLQDRANDKVKSLSGGMRRRLGIAQAFMGNPEMILLDEPTVGLDPKERLRFQGMVSEYRNSDTTIILSTHIVSDIETLCDKIIVMKQGDVLGVYTTKELANMASDKTYLVSEEMYEKIQDEVTLISQTWRKEEKVIRVLSDKPVGEKVENTTVEDGYMWITR